MLFFNSLFTSCCLNNFRCAVVLNVCVAFLYIYIYIHRYIHTYIHTYIHMKLDYVYAQSVKVLRMYIDNHMNQRIRT